MIAMQMLDITNVFQLALPGKLANLVTESSSLNSSKSLIFLSPLDLRHFWLFNRDPVGFYCIFSEALQAYKGCPKFTSVEGRYNIGHKPHWASCMRERISAFSKVSRHCLQVDSRVRGQLKGSKHERACRKVTSEVRKVQWECVYVRTHWLSLFSYPVDKIPFHFLGDFHQQLSQLSSIGHMSPWAVGCLLDVSFESVCTEFLKER